MTDWSSVRLQLIERVGESAVVPMPSAISQQELPVEGVAVPRSVEQLQQVVEFASSQDLPMYPLGGCTALALGTVGSKAGLGVSTLALDRVIDYPSRDMTISVEAGMQLGRLRELLAAEGQRLPIDVPHAKDATIGGTIAANLSGPRRYGSGTLRDYIIGISVVDAMGKLTKAGGRVVKNVAGYDLCKLYTGSLGTLGIISQVTLKLKPLPEASSIIWLPCTTAKQLAEVLDRLAASATRPVAIDVMNQLAAEQVLRTAGLDAPVSAWVIAIGLEDSADAVAWQQGRLSEELTEFFAARRIFEGANTDRVWQALTEFQAAEIGTMTFKANVRSSAVVEFLEFATVHLQDWPLQSHAGNGVVFGHSSHDEDLDCVRMRLDPLRAKATEFAGNLTIRRCPTEWKSHLRVHGTTRSDAWLMQAIKSKLDPKNLLNPGRLFGP